MAVELTAKGLGAARKWRRRVGPQQVEEGGLRAEVERTGKA
jgi:hypothetical protein